MNYEAVNSYLTIALLRRFRPLCEILTSDCLDDFI